jgi:anti-sigma B factor antagonist
MDWFFSIDDLEIEILYLDRGAEVILMGALDLATAPGLREHLSELVSQGWIDITIDIAELRFLDSIGLSVLIMTQKRVEEMGGSLVVHYPTKAALKLFDTTGLTARLISTDRANELIRIEGERDQLHDLSFMLGTSP